MKKNISLFSAVLFLSFMLALRLAALADQTDYSAGKSGNAFLDIGVGARAVAMGEAFTGLASDATALYWNPAGLGQLDDIQVMLMHDQWFQNTLVEYGAATLPLFGGVLGVSATYVSYGSMDKTDELGQNQGTFSAYDMDVTLGYGMHLSDYLLAGLALKVPMNTIDHTSTVSVAGDLGLLYIYPGWEKLRVGFDVMNAGTISADTTQPTQVKLGFGVVDAVQGLDMGLDISKRVFDNTLQTNVGAEYWILGMIAPRAGYEFSASDSGINGFTAGLGWKQHLGEMVLNLDYAYVPFGNLGDTHRISLLLEFGSGAKSAKPAAASRSSERIVASRSPQPVAAASAVPAAAPAPVPAEAPQKWLQPPAAVSAKKSGTKVLLTWNKNEASTALGYNVYQRLGEKGRFQKINHQPVTLKTFQTGALKPGKVYYFKLTGVDAQGNESEPTDLVKFKK